MATNPAPVALQTTYLVVTAENILKRYGIQLSKADVMLALQDKKSFISQLVAIPAANVYNNILMEQFRENMSFNKAQLSAILIHHYDQQASGSSNALPEVVNELQHDYDNLTAALKTAQEQHQEAITNIDKVTQSHLAKWRAQQKENALLITRQMQEHGFKLSSDFVSRLQKKLEQGGKRYDVPQEILDKLNIKESNPIINAAIATLMEEDN